MIGRITRKIRRELLRFFSFEKRPSSYPYISGDTFRKLADHLYDETAKCRPEDIGEEEIVFIKTDFLDEFFTQIHPRIKCRYKIITHNSDINITEKESKYIDEKIIRWFAQNALVNHPKITPIPIGFENLHYYQNGIVKIFKKLSDKETSKKNRILFGFNVFTNQKERMAALEALRKAPFADEIKDRLGPRPYLSRLQQYKFVGAPNGNGVDTHRIWEAAVLGTIPITTSNPVAEHFKKIGLPVYIIKNWSDLENLSEKQLEKIYQEIMSISGPIKDNLIAFHYWQGIIRSPEKYKDEAIVCISTGRKFFKKYQKFFKKSHELLAFDLRRPLILVKEYIKKTSKPPTWQKLLTFRTPILSNIKRVMLLDADIYIKDSSENPLNEVPGEHWGLAPNNAFGLETLKKTDLTLYKHCPSENRPSFVLNCGFFIVNKNIHREIMEYVFKNYEEQICEEQGPLCYHLINEFKGTILPFKFNNIVGSYMEKFGYSMSTVVNLYQDSNFLHFAGNANRKILRLFRIWKRFPIILIMMKWPPVLFFLNQLTFIIKKMKRI